MGLFNCRRVGELEADADRLRRKMLRERAQKEQLARGIEDAQRQMAFEKETAQAVEAALIKKSKDLEEYVMISSWFTALMIPCPFREVAEYEAVVERMRTELDVYKDRNRRSVLQQPSDERGRNSSCKQSLSFCFQLSDCSKVITLLAGTSAKTPGAAAAASSFPTRTINRSTSTSPSDGDEEDESLRGNEEKKLKKQPSHNNR